MDTRHLKTGRQEKEKEMLTGLVLATCRYEQMNAI